MVMRTRSRSRRSFESTSQAMRSIDRYLLSRRHEDIAEADRNIEEAVKADVDYALAIYYRGVVHDLGGTPADAVQYFERILRECDDHGLKLKSRFNLGVSYYHQYSHRWLKKADECFRAIIQDPEYDELLVALAKAHRAQTLAMWMRPSSQQNAADAAVQAEITSHFENCEQIVVALRTQQKLIPQVEATAANALGIANMYITDHVATAPEDKRKHLLVAQEELQKAEKILPNDWANTCDLASLSLRLGVLARDTGTGDADAHFAETDRQLKRVVAELRPEYGFALYELGILCRVWGKWDEAENFQERAKAVPERYRDVRESRVERELERVAQQDADYP